MSNFSFGNIKAGAKKSSHFSKIETNPVLVDNSNVSASYDCIPIILADEIYEDAALSGINRFLKASGLTRYKILAAVNCHADKDQVKKQGKIEFYKINRSKFEDYIPQFSPIITVGPALYSLLMEDDIYPSHVQQYIFGVPFFRFSKDLTYENCHVVFPIESFRDLFALGFQEPVKSFKTELARKQIKRCLLLGDQPIPEFPKLNKIFIESQEDFETRFYLPNKDRKNEVLAWDIETSGFNFLKDEIGCITLSFDGETGYYLPWRYVDKKKLGEILKNNRQCGANLKFDVKFLWSNGVPEATIDEDVIVLGHVFDETRSNSLKALAFYYTEFGGYERPLDAYKRKVQVDSYLDIPEELLREYAVMDAIVTRRVWENMMKHLHDLDKKYPNEFYPANGLEQYYYDRNIPAANMYAKIEYRGCYMDKKRLDNLRQEMKEHIAGLKQQLCEAFDVASDFKWESGKDLGKLLERKGWEDLGRQKSGEYATADFQLKRWEKTHKKESKLIQDLREMNVLLNSFVGDDSQKSIFNDFFEDLNVQGELDFGDEDEDYEYDDLLDEEKGTKGWAQYLTYHPEDSSYRMHADYFSMGTDSGRTRCQHPNLQNTPAHSKWAQKIKRCFCTPDDDNYYLLTADYASLQARLAAIDTWSPQDNIVQALCKPDADLHSSTGFLCFSNNKEYEIEEIEVEQDGEIYHFLGKEQVLTQRGEIFASDLKETDTLIIKDENA